ncbi:TPA: hypothetical protein ACJHMI_005492 [Bacillus cereus]
MFPKQSLKIPPKAWDALTLLRKKLEGTYSGQYGFGVGYKRVLGKFLDQVALVVYVPNKLPPEQVPLSQLVPTVFEDFPTDVVECQIKSLAGDNKRYDDLHGGIEISHVWIDNQGNERSDGNGTLGCIAIKDNEKVFLTCEHVVSRMSNGVSQNNGLGMTINQPGLGSPGSRKIGKCIGTSLPFDAAIIKPTDDSVFNNILATIEEIGPVKGKFTINRDNLNCDFPSTIGIVSKCGKATGLTHGVIVCFTTRAPSTTPAAIEIISINAALGIPFADPGDSGSAVVNSDQKVVGILNSINSYDPLKLSAFAVLIDPICDALGIDIAVDP